MVEEGTEPCCPILTATSWLPLAPGDGCAHVASLLGMGTAQALRFPVGHSWQPWLGFRMHAHGFPVGHWKQPHPRFRRPAHGLSDGLWRQLHRKPRTWFSMHAPVFLGLPVGVDRSPACLRRAGSPTSRGQKVWSRRPEWAATGVDPPRTLSTIQQDLWGCMGWV
jgi:hypothetical protein